MRANLPSRGRSGRSGITLTEILIAILIMGVGLVSLATLFPLGLLRIRRAMQDSRSTLFAESAISEAKARDLFTIDSFASATWYNTPFPNGPFVDPWRGDSLNNGGDGLIWKGAGVVEPGIPVCYDPLWWAINDYQTFSSGTRVIPPAFRAVARFGNANNLANNSAAFIRPDPATGLPSAYGLQRITNFRPRISPGDGFPFVYPTPLPSPPGDPGAPDVATAVFASPDNILFSGEGEESPGQGANDISPLLPDLSLSGNNTMTFDLEFTWFFTGYRVNVQDDSSYVGSIVVCHNRPMALETINSPFGGPVTVAAGERVVEAVWGYSGAQVEPLNNQVGYGRGEKSVLLRWPDSIPDPVIRTGTFIADVSYEIRATVDNPANNPLRAVDRYPWQRCDWYRIASYTTPEYGLPFNGDPGGAQYRQTIVTLETPVKARTLVSRNNGQPVHVNAALIHPYVVNVFPKTFVNRSR
jgi:type II secretory pathway pseudopilin PulG